MRLKLETAEGIVCSADCTELKEEEERARGRGVTHLTPHVFLMKLSVRHHLAFIDFSRWPAHHRPHCNLHYTPTGAGRRRGAAEPILCFCRNCITVLTIYIPGWRLLSWNTCMCIYVQLAFSIKRPGTDDAVLLERVWSFLKLLVHCSLAHYVWQ